MLPDVCAVQHPENIGYKAELGKAQAERLTNFQNTKQRSYGKTLPIESGSHLRRRGSNEQSGGSAIFLSQ